MTSTSPNHKLSIWQKIFTSPKRKTEYEHDMYLREPRNRHDQRTTSSELTLKDDFSENSLSDEEQLDNRSILFGTKSESDASWETSLRPLTSMSGSDQLHYSDLPSDPTERAAMRARELFFEEELKRRLAKRGFTKINNQTVGSKRAALESELKRLAHDYGYKDFGRYSLELKVTRSPPPKPAAWEIKPLAQLSPMERAQKLKHEEEQKEEALAEGYTKISWS